MLLYVSEFHSFLKLSNIPLYVYTTFLLVALFTQLSFHGHLGFFHFLVFMNNTAMNMGVQICVYVPAFNSFGSISRSGIVGHMIILCLVF